MRNNRVLLAGFGNEFRGDDGVGIFIARGIEKRDWSGVTVLRYQGEGLDIIEKWQGFEAVVLVDAVSSGGPPGTVHRIQIPEQELSSHFQGCSTHAFSIAQTIALAKTLKRLPSRLIIYGIEGASFEMGSGLSSDVKEAAQGVINQIIKDIEAIGCR